METNLIVIIVITVLFAAAVITSILWVLKRKRDAIAAYEALFKYLPGKPYVSFSAMAGAKVDPQRLSEAYSHAFDCLTRPYGSVPPAWEAPELSGILVGMKIVVHPELAWVDSWGREVAGLAWPETRSVEVGLDFAALCHEMAELAYTATTGEEDWQARQWTGQAAVTQAVADFCQRMKEIE